MAIAYAFAIYKSCIVWPFECVVGRILTPGCKGRAPCIVQSLTPPVASLTPGFFLFIRLVRTKFPAKPTSSLSVSLVCSPSAHSTFQPIMSIVRVSFSHDPWSEGGFRHDYSPRPFRWPSTAGSPRYGQTVNLRASPMLDPRVRRRHW